MTQPRRSTINKSIDLQASLAIVSLLELHLAKEESYGYHIEVEIYNHTITLAQGNPDSKDSPGTERVAAITFPYRVSSEIIIEFGLATSFETMEELDTDPRPMALYDTKRLCESSIDSMEVKSVSFNHNDFDGAVNFLYKWLFPEIPASA